VKSILELSVSSRASSISDNDEEVERKSTFDINMRGGGNTSNKDDSNVSVGRWPCGDALDKQLIKIALPCIANFAINPLVGAVDLFWVSKMGNALAVAGQSAANQVFNSAFWLISFLPSVTATLVAKESAKKSEEGVQDAVSQALVVGTMMAIIGTILILSNPSSVLSAVLSGMCQDYNFFLFL
jgi:Na+-driven multidrug efflux pump